MENFKPKREDYWYWGLWKQPTISAVFWLDWYTTESFKKIHQDHSFKPVLYLDGNFLYRKEDWLKIKDIVWKNLKNDQSINSYCDRLEEVVQECKRNSLALLNENSSDSEYIQKLFKTHKEITAVWEWVTFVGENVQQYVLEKGMMTEQELSEEVIKATPMTWLEIQNVEVSEFSEFFKNKGETGVTAETFEKYPEVKEKIEKHIKEFSWYGTHHWVGDEYNLSECLRQINEQMPKTSSHRRESVYPSNAFVRIMALATYWRTHCAEVVAKVVFGSRGVLEQIAKMQNVSYDDFVYLLPDEMIEISEGEKLEKAAEIINERKKGFGYVILDGKGNIITGKILTDLIDVLVEKPKDDIQEFSGKVASKGEIVTARAKVILEPKDFEKLEPGDVLVAAETTPDFVPIMKRASAIITDRGGITSHAAIVSRELKKPCIIGTKIGTQVLKDGDMVEVDTDSGVVRKI